MIHERRLRSVVLSDVGRSGSIVATLLGSHFRDRGSIL